MAARDQVVASRIGEATNTLGEIIAAYRRRRRQQHRNLPWSQEDLAFASGTDQAHISRIESNRQHPEYSTLLRICDALALSQSERAYLLALAGYQTAAPLPDDEAVDAVLSKLGPLLDSYPYPAVLLDEGERLWHVNPFVVTFWGECYGAATQEECLVLVRGRRTVEFLFDPDHYGESLARWKACYEDIDHVLVRNVALLWRVFRVRPRDPDLNRIVGQLKHNADFFRIWKRLEDGESDLLYVDHDTYVTSHPVHGRLQWHAWRTRAAVDERFIVVHFSPVDGTTSHVLERLVETTSKQTVSSSPGLAHHAPWSTP